MRKILLGLLLLAPSLSHAQTPTNALTSVFYIAADGNCADDPCTSATRRMCRNSGTSLVIYACDTSAGFYTAVASGGAANPGGSNTQLQFNDTGNFGGSSNLTFDKSTGAISSLLKVSPLGIASPASLGLGIVLPDPTLAPTVAQSAAAGLCITGSTYKTRIAFGMYGKVTSVGPQSAPITMGANKKITVTRSETVPSGATAWLVYWERTSGTPTSPALCGVTLDNAGVATGTTTYDCTCSGTTTNPGNNTGAIRGTGIASLGQGIIDVATLSGTTMNTATEGSHRADLSGPLFQYSPDGGSTWTKLKNPARTIDISASGGDYTSLGAACSANTATSAAPIIFRVHPGVYTGAQTCTGQDTFAISCDPGVFFDEGNTASGNHGAIQLGTSKNVYMEGCTTGRAHDTHRGVWWDAASAGGGSAYFVNNTFISAGVQLDEDGWFGRDFPSGSKFFFLDNRVSIYADGITIDDIESDNVEVHGEGNYFWSDTGTVGLQNAAWAIRAIPCLFTSTGDRFKITGSRSGAASRIIAYHLDGNASSPTETCSGGARAIIQNPTIEIRNSSGPGGGNQGLARAIDISGTATELGTVIVNSPSINVSTADSSAGDALGIRQDTSGGGDTTTVVQVNGGTIRTSGAPGGSNCDVKFESQAATMYLNGVDFQSQCSGAGSFLAPDTQMATIGGQLQIPHSTTPPAVDCDAAGEVGRLYWDTDAQTDGAIYGCRGAAGWKLAGGGGGGTPSGADTQVQFNDGGNFGGDTGMVWTKATDKLTVAGNITASDYATSATTAGQVVISEATANGTEGITLRSAASRVNNLTVDFPDVNVTDTAVLTATTQTLTGKTLDAEGTGNVLTTVEKYWFPAATCNSSGVAWTNLSIPASGGAAIACIAGSNVKTGYADFDQTTDNNVQGSLMLPADWNAGALDVTYKWLTTATSGSVAWCFQAVCVADSETGDPAFPAQAAGNCVSDAAKGTTNQFNDVTKTGISTTGCAAGELMYFRVSRDPDETGGQTDTVAANARLAGFEITIRRAQ